MPPRFFRDHPRHSRTAAEQAPTPPPQPAQPAPAMPEPELVAIGSSAPPDAPPIDQQAHAQDAQHPVAMVARPLAERILAGMGPDLGPDAAPPGATLQDLARGLAPKDPQLQQDLVQVGSIAISTSTEQTGTLSWWRSLAVWRMKDYLRHERQDTKHRAKLQKWTLPAQKSKTTGSKFTRAASDRHTKYSPLSCLYSDQYDRAIFRLARGLDPLEREVLEACIEEREPYVDASRRLGVKVDRIAQIANKLRPLVNEIRQKFIPVRSDVKTF